MTMNQTHPEVAESGPALLQRLGPAMVAALVLVVAGDLLLLWTRPGLGMALFFLLVGIATFAIQARWVERKPAAVSATVLALSLLPFVEAPGWLSLLSALFGLSIVALAAAQILPGQIIDLPESLVRFGLVAPGRFIGDGVRVLAAGAAMTLGQRLARALLVWVVPVGLAVVFAGLFAAANPLIESWLVAIRLDSFLSLLDPGRIVLWVLIGWFAWPFLRPALFRGWPAEPVQGPMAPRAESLLLGRATILNSLVVFNLLFLGQTGLDVAYLWGGLALPDGMTYANYAHRGAYPLIATALLAAAFVLVAMRPGGRAEDSKPVRWLVFVWIGQNVLLVVSSILRLSIYVETYSLTELRFAAGIWMGLVAAGLALILVRIALRRSNKWLICMNLLTLGLTLYVSGLLDFSAMIARYNVEHSREMSGSGTPLDIAYMRELGPSAIPALDEFITARLHAQESVPDEWLAARDGLYVRFTDRERDWRGWSFREQRLADYLRDKPIPLRTPGATNGFDLF